MDKIWYRNPLKSEVIGRCGRIKTPDDHAEPTKKHTKKQYSPIKIYKILTENKSENEKSLKRITAKYLYFLLFFGSLKDCGSAMCLNMT